MLNLISSLTAKAECSPTRLDYTEGQSRKLIDLNNKCTQASSMLCPSTDVQKQPNDCDHANTNQLEAKAKANELENMNESSASSARGASQTVIIKKNHPQHDVNHVIRSKTHVR